MNTTRTTTEREAQIPYTVVGGPRWDRVRRYPFALTLLVLSRGDRLYRAELLRDLSARRLGEILWVEGPEASADIESLAREFPDIRFLLIKAASTVGEWLNIAIAESRAPLVLSMWSDTRISAIPEALPARLERSAALCTVPIARNARFEVIPSWQAPFLKRRRFSLSFRIPRRDGEPTLFPFDFCGVYDRERFARSGGFDPAIKNPYWQKLDFGVRCFLWGERIAGTTGLTLSYTGSPPEDDATPDQGYKLFWLKCIAVTRHHEMGALAARRALEYMAHSDTGAFYALREFRAARAWVRTHRYRFRLDPRELVERWESA
jgi:hypothetical protein